MEYVGFNSLAASKSRLKQRGSEERGALECWCKVRLYGGPLTGVSVLGWQGNVAHNNEYCILDGKFKELVSEKNGFEWVDERKPDQEVLLITHVMSF